MSFKLAEKKTTVDGRNVIKLQFQRDSHDLFAIKNMKGSLNHGKFWTCPIRKEILFTLFSRGFSFDQGLLHIFNQCFPTDLNLQPIDIPGLPGVLRPFQNMGVSFIDYNKGRALIADEMGLGKTIQALAWIFLYQGIRPILVIAPSSAKYNWYEESLKWLKGIHPVVLCGRKPYKFNEDFAIINYDILINWTDELKKYNPKLIITDECHYYKNNASKRSQAVKLLGRMSPYFLALSGTPIENRPYEIFNAVDIIRPGLLGNFREFVMEFCNGHYDNKGKLIFTGASNTQKLNRILTQTVMIRRLKKDVLPELPDKTFTFLPFDISNQSDYNELSTKLLTGLDNSWNNNREKYWGMVEKLKQLAITGILKQIFQWIEDFLISGEKLVIFAEHLFVLKELSNHFDKDIWVKIDGSVPSKKRKEVEKEFQTNETIKLFFGQMKAAAESLTLTASSNTLIVEYPWNPGRLNQVIDRVHRIPQTNKVNVYFPVPKGTIVETIIQILDRKIRVVNSALDGKNLYEDSIFSELINSLIK